MPKKMRAIRLGERTWGQLDSLVQWLQVENKTQVIEVLIEREAMKMEVNSQQQIDQALKTSHPIGSSVTVTHPGSGKDETATITSYTTDDMQSSLANGVMVRFSDGTILDVPHYCL